MQIKRIAFSLLIISGLLLAACAPAPAAPGAVMEEKPAAAAEMMDSSKDDMPGAGHGAMEGTPMAGDGMDKSKDDMAKGSSMSGDAGMSGDKSMAEEGAMDDKSGMEDKNAMGDQGDMQAGMMEAPAWFSAELSDVRSGETFRLADFKGKVVLVETLAVWCSTCLRQQKQVEALHDLLGERDDFVSLGLDIDPNEDAALLLGHADKNGFDWRYAVAPVSVSRQLGELYGAQFLNPPSAPMLIVDRHGQVHTLPFGVKSAEDLLAALQPFLDEGM